MKIYRASDFFSKDFPFAIRHTVNSDEKFNASTRFKREFWKITYIISGDGELIINNEAYPICKGSVYLVHPDSETTYSIRHGAMEIYNIVFDDSFIEKELVQLKDNFHFFSIFSAPASPENSSLYIQDGNSRIYRLIREMEQEYEEKNVNYRQFLKFSLLKLLILMLRSGEKRKFHRSPRQIVDFTNHFISNNFRGKIELASLASQIGITKNYLCSVYKTHTGGTIIGTVNEMRLKHAFDLLNEGAMTVSSACFLSGFEDLSYFNRMFKRRYGASPRVCRKKLGQY